MLPGRLMDEDFEHPLFLYGKVKPDDVASILAFHQKRLHQTQHLARPSDEAINVGLNNPQDGFDAQKAGENPPATLVWQTGMPTLRDLKSRVALENVGIIDPCSLDDYLARQGYTAIKNLVTSKRPEEVRQLVRTSGLRGRGGAGFLTAAKWDFAAGEPTPKYLICNGDEGDPGAFMDRSVMEGDPHKLLEGMAIAGFAIGADEAYIYVRAEYPLAIKRLRKAIADAEEKN
ncbi:MAG: hypothetical protein J6Y94_00170, partial [Bacteriovoracaceae bacterium]|nr:hypothetical protein [Bacteriovoracaceae bacterium]